MLTKGLDNGRNPFFRYLIVFGNERSVPIIWLFVRVKKIQDTHFEVTRPRSTRLGNVSGVAKTTGRRWAIIGKMSGVGNFVKSNLLLERWVVKIAGFD